MMDDVLTPVLEGLSEYDRSIIRKAFRIYALFGFLFGFLTLVALEMVL